MRWSLLLVSLLYPMLSGFEYSDGSKVSKTVSSSNLSSVESQQLQRLGKLFSHSAIDARVDPQWHAIPGLYGWEFDFEASRKKTQQAHDQSLFYLVWNPVPPKTRLADLPAEPIYRGPSEKSGSARFPEEPISLIFHVSQGEAYILPILKILQNAHVQATFFLDGDWVKKYPHLARRIIAGGHNIGSFGLGQPDFRKLSKPQLESQITDTNEILFRTLGKKPMLLAPPAGAYDNRVVKIARTHHMYTILWTVNTANWGNSTVSSVVSRANKEVNPGDFVLMPSNAQTVHLLPTLILALKDRKYVFKTVEHVVSEQRYFIPSDEYRKYPQVMRIYRP